MSGGGFTNHTYADSTLAHEIFGWDVSAVYGFGPDKFYSEVQDEENGHYSHNYNRKPYLQNIKHVRKRDPFDDVLISELVYDVFCLIHSKDWAESGDTEDDQYTDDVRAFKDKWFGGRYKKDYIKDLIDEKIEATKQELYQTFEVGEVLGDGT